MPPFAVPTYVDRFYAWGSLDDGSPFARLAFRRTALLRARPMYVADLEVPFVVDAAQDLPRGAPA